MSLYLSFALWLCALSFCINSELWFVSSWIITKAHWNITFLNNRWISAMNDANCLFYIQFYITDYEFPMDETSLVIFQFSVTLFCATVFHFKFPRVAYTFLQNQWWISAFYLTACLFNLLLPAKAYYWHDIITTVGVIEWITTYDFSWLNVIQYQNETKQYLCFDSVSTIQHFLFFILNFKLIFLYSQYNTILIKKKNILYIVCNAKGIEFTKNMTI